MWLPWDQPVNSGCHGTRIFWCHCIALYQGPGIASILRRWLRTFIGDLPLMVTAIDSFQAVTTGQQTQSLILSPPSLPCSPPGIVVSATGASISNADEDEGGNTPEHTGQSKIL